MQGFRTIASFVRLLVALFLLAQFSGVVSAPLAGARGAASAVVSHVAHQDAHDRDSGRCAHHRGDVNGSRADYCCALHAFFAGVLPSTVTAEVVVIAGQRLAVEVADIGLGVDPGRLDRPPRPLSFS